MNVLNTSDDQSFVEATQAKLLGSGMQDLRSFAASASRLKDALEAMKTLDDENMERRAGRMIRQIEAFEPSVTMIGQIKSGKTSLVNAMVGTPDLLPADVNPWTSVVTSLHLHPQTANIEKSASFKFFDEDEWDRLISGGGRIGELASRAGADDELEKIKKQVAEMREKSRSRLGRKFEMLLGQQRDYGYFDKELIERYVCLGEEPDEDEQASQDTQGRFADITKSANLNMQRAALPVRLCIRDTPGVNDTFMMREQITIRAIRDSGICVVVLSAHQALSSTDMALIRLISNVKSRDVIIFVNRVDELPNPEAQIPQIESSIEQTLKKHKGPQNAEVIFGSALWALYALQMKLDDLPKASADALTNWAAIRRNTLIKGAGSELLAWEMSGLPALQAAISARVREGAGSALLQRLAESMSNLTDGLVASDRIVDENTKRPVAPEMNSADARTEIREIIDTQSAKLRSEFDDILTGFSERMDRVQESFLERATSSLIVHLEKNGELSPWTYDPAGLRVLLSASHKVLARKSKATWEQATRLTCEQLSDVYSKAFSLGPADIHITPPRAPEVPSPVSIGRTIALDLNGSWWKRWWLQRRGYKAYAASFYDLIKSETNPVISELRDELAVGVRSEAIESFEAFTNEQFSVFETLERKQSASPEQLREFISKKVPQERVNAIALIRKTLDEVENND